MRNSIVNAIHARAKQDPNIVFLTADLGYSVIDDLQAELPDQCINVGIAEQNMIGVAAGLALSGKKVFVYSIIPFATMRCFEQIRVDLCYQNLDVTIIGIGGGLAYGTHGATHHSIEDVALMRSLPNMKVIAPADPYEAVQLIEQVLDTAGPTYVRLNRGGEPRLFDDEAQYGDIEIGKVHTLQEGASATIFVCGDLSHTAMNAAKQLEDDGISTKVVSVHTIKPLDTMQIQRIARESGVVVTLEEHNVIGGLGSAVSEVIAEANIDVKFKRLGVQDMYLGVIGKQDFLREKCEICVDSVVRDIKSLCTQ